MTVTIKLSRNGKHSGKYKTIIDDIDKDLSNESWIVSLFKKRAYAKHIRSVDGSSITLLLHRVIMERIMGRKLKRNEWVSHKNGDGLDNRRSNLYITTRSERVRKNPQKNKVGLTGVEELPSGRFKAAIRINGKKKHLGVFDTPEQAHDAYLDAVKSQNLQK